jgi:microcystin-dependent protein
MAAQLVDHGLNDDETYQWLLCAGDGSGNPRVVSKAAYTNLWAALGEPTVDGSGNFPIPNLSGRVPIGVGKNGSLTTRTFHAVGGEETHVLLTAEMPTHNHGGQTGTGMTAATTTEPSFASGTTESDLSTGNESNTHAHGVQSSALSEYTVDIQLGSTPAGFATGVYFSGGYGSTSSDASALHTHSIPALEVSVVVPALTVDGAAVPALSIANAGGDTAHNNMPPFFGLNFFIKS